MNDTKMSFAVVVIAAVAVTGGILSAILVKLITFDKVRGIERSVPVSTAGELEGAVLFNPPRPEEAPPSIRDTVMLGYRILTETQKYAPDYVGNKLNCTNCHFDGGREKETISLVGASAVYPKYRKRHHDAVDLVTRTNSCFERSLNGRPLPPESKEMTAIITYYQWISKNLPIYGEIPWLGLRPLKSDHKSDMERGNRIYAGKCAVCHGVSGEGTPIAPPLWGPDSFNDGAGMSTPKTFAAFTHRFMPKGAPDLTVEQSLDVAAFGTAQPRPHFKGKKGPEDVE